jgi:hypothetical protein
VLLYSAALLPLWFALTAPHRHIWRIAAAALIPTLVATGPALFSRKEAREFGVLASKNDMLRPAAAKPKTIEFIGDGASGLFVYSQAVGDNNASCNEICSGACCSMERPTGSV